MTNLQPKQFQQLQMFMKPSEIKAMPNFEFGDQGKGDTEEGLRQYKLGEADAGGPIGSDYPSLAREIEAEGVHDPIRLFHLDNAGHGPNSTRLINGHHRYFVQERRERRGEEVYLPVSHSELRARR